MPERTKAPASVGAVRIGTSEKRGLVSLDVSPFFVHLLFVFGTLSFSVALAPSAAFSLPMAGLRSSWASRYYIARKCDRMELQRRMIQHRHPLSTMSISISRARPKTKKMSLSMASRSASSGSENTTVPSTLSLPPVPMDAHRFVMMRHGESEFNNANIFTGWCDVALTQRGIVEAVEAGEVFRSYELTFDKCYTSLLTRSIVTAQRTLETAGIAYTPIKYDWRLNERHYGALQGLSKDRTADRLGRAKVMAWRRSFFARPPLMTSEHPHYRSINHDHRYKHLDREILPLGESLEDCQKRVVEGWNDIVKEGKEGKRGDPSHDGNQYSLLVAHANTLRALVMHLDDIPATDIEGLNIPTAIPFYYDISMTTGEVVTGTGEQQASLTSQDPIGFRGVYISDERKKRNFLERRRAANDPWLVSDNWRFFPQCILYVLKLNFLHLCHLDFSGPCMILPFREVCWRLPMRTRCPRKF